MHTLGQQQRQLASGLRHPSHGRAALAAADRRRQQRGKCRARAQCATWRRRHLQPRLTAAHASAGGDQQQQQPAGADLQALQAAAAAAAQGAAAVQALEAEVTAAQVAEEQQSNAAADAAAAAQHQHHALAGAGWRRTSHSAYVALAGGLAAAGALLAGAAGPLAAGGLRLGASVPAAQGAVLLGCFGAAVLRAASLAWFLAEGAALGELGSWRYQRINLGLGAAAAAAAAVSLTAGWAGAAPWLPLALAAASAAVAALCGSLAVGQARREGGRGFYFASALGYGDVFEGLRATAGYLLYALTCLPGLIAAGLVVLGLGGGLAALGGGAAGLPSLPWLSASASGAAAAALLRQLLAVGLLLLGLHAWALMEPAAEARDISAEDAVKLAAVRSAELAAMAAGHYGPAPVHAPPARFRALHAGFALAAAVQGGWLAAGAAGGPGAGLLNGPDPLWGALFWSVMGSAAYLGACAARLDYADLSRLALQAVDVAGGWVARGAALLYIDWIWVTPVVRR